MNRCTTNSVALSVRVQRREKRGILGSLKRNEVIKSYGLSAGYEDKGKGESTLYLVEWLNNNNNKWPFQILGKIWRNWNSCSLVVEM